MVPGAEFLLGSEQELLVRQNKRTNPLAVDAREVSRTEFEGLDQAQAASLARQAFPGVLDRSAGGAPQLPRGARVLDYATAHVAQVSLPGKQRGIVESIQPIAMPSGKNGFTPINLALRQAGEGYAPTTSDTAVRIPKRLSAGVSTPGNGVSLTPVDAHGNPLNGSHGALDGMSVLYANTLAATDTLVKPTVDGFQIDALLRGIESPQQLYFKVGMPGGARLVGGRSGAVRVVRGAETLAMVLPPVAQDAAESSVPVSMSVSGEKIVLSVDHRAGSYQYPIEVDPSIIDHQLTKEGAKRSNWEFSPEPSGSTNFGHTYAACKGPGDAEELYLETCSSVAYKAKESAAWIYQTTGNSKIFEVKAETEAENTSARIESRIELEDGGAVEEFQQLSTEFKEPKYSKKALLEPLCPKGKTTCTSSYGGEKNAVHFQQSVTTEGGSKFYDYLNTAELSISEPEEHATTKYNTTSSELKGKVINVKGEKEELTRKNVLDGGGWLSEHAGAVGLISEDKGIGVSATQLEFESSPGKWEVAEKKHNYLTEEDLCKGYQCEPKNEEFWVLSPKLPNGEDKIRYRAEDGMAGTESTEAEGLATVKVDTSKPHGLKIHGLPFGNELSEKEYNLTVEAADGEGSTVPSSGIESIALYIDGKLIGTNGGTGGKEGTEGKCSATLGECKATAKWTFNGAELGAGKHQIQIVARDRASNEEQAYIPVSISHSTPVALGPGSVDLESGDYTLSTSDVSLGSGLTVSRAYSSRALEEGDEGPLGPQWSFTVGGSVESLVELVDHSMLLTGNNGKQTIFAYIEPKEPKTESPTYESPVGDSNLALTVEENKTTKVKEAFYLEDAADHTKTKFTLPSGGTKDWVPTVDEGAVEKTDTVTYAYKTAEQHAEYPVPSGSKPTGIVGGPGGSLWVTNGGTNKIAKISLAGVPTEYAVPNGAQPNSITEGPEGELWFTEAKTKTEDVTTIGKMTPLGKMTFYDIPEKSETQGIALGPEKYMWYTLYGINKIAKIPAGAKASGEAVEYSLPAGSEPSGITEGPEGNMWFVDYGTNKVAKITKSGSVTEFSLPAGSEPRGIADGSDKKLWFVDYGTGKVGEIPATATSSSEITEYTLPAGSKPVGITAGPDGNLWFTDSGTNKIGKTTTSGKLTEFSLPSSSEPWNITVGPDQNLWFTESGTNEVGTITTSGTITEATEARAPQPKGVKCEWTTKPTEMAKGCRALEFEYDKSGTTAKGETETEWGTYLGRLEKVSMVAWNPAVGVEKMQEIAVAEYSYDKRGRLRAEWDPRVSPALKTTYGYDEEGHVTAMTPPGHESWAFTYGAIAGDTGTGRLLKATQAPATTALW
ncbi:MAG: hypothetical protein WCB99_14400, partial [Candidatus Cybelea sp.]